MMNHGDGRPPYRAAAAADVAAASSHLPSFQPPYTPHHTAIQQAPRSFWGGADYDPGQSWPNPVSHQQHPPPIPKQHYSDTSYFQNETNMPPPPTYNRASGEHLYHTAPFSFVGPSPSPYYPSTVTASAGHPELTHYGYNQKTPKSSTHTAYGQVPYHHGQTPHFDPAQQRNIQENQPSNTPKIQSSMKSSALTNILHPEQRHPDQGRLSRQGGADSLCLFQNSYDSSHKQHSTHHVQKNDALATTPGVEQNDEVSTSSHQRDGHSHHSDSQSKLSQSKLNDMSLRTYDSCEVSEITAASAGAQGVSATVPYGVIPSIHSKITDEHVAKYFQHAHVFVDTIDPASPLMTSSCLTEDHIQAYKKKLGDIHESVKNILQAHLAKRVRAHASTKFHVQLSMTADVLKLQRELIQALPIYCKDSGINRKNLSSILWALKVPYKLDLSWLPEAEREIEQKWGIKILPNFDQKSLYKEILSALGDSHCQTLRAFMLRNCGAVWYDIQIWKPDLFGANIRIKPHQLKVVVQVQNSTRVLDGYLLHADDANDPLDALKGSAPYEFGLHAMNVLKQSNNYSEFIREGNQMLNILWNQHADAIQVSFCKLYDGPIVLLVLFSIRFCLQRYNSNTPFALSSGSLSQPHQISGGAHFQEQSRDARHAHLTTSEKERRSSQDSGGSLSQHHNISAKHAPITTSEKERRSSQGSLALVSTAFQNVVPDGRASGAKALTKKESKAIERRYGHHVLNGVNKELAKRSDSQTEIHTTSMKGVTEKSENSVKKSSKKAEGTKEIKKRKRSKYIRMFAMGVAFNPVPVTFTLVVLLFLISCSI
jgi:hypothetical protein